MINVNTLIQNAFQRCSLVGDGQAATGTQAMSGVNDLNCLIAELNGQNLLMSNYNTVDEVATDKIVVGPVPEGVKLFDNYDYATGYLQDRPDEFDVDDIIKLDTPSGNYEYYFIRTFMGAKQLFTTSKFDKNCKEMHLFPDIVVGAYSKNLATYHGPIEVMPDRLLGCARKIGNRWVQLYPSNKMKIDTRTKMSLSTLFSTETENKLFRLEDREYHFDRFVIEFDSTRQSNYRLTYLEEIPAVKLDDNLYIDSKYESMLEDGLCVKLCQRYKLMDIKADFEADFVNQKNIIKRINNNNQPMLYDMAMGDNWYDNVANGYGGVGW